MNHFLISFSILIINLVIENNVDDQGSISLSTKSQQLQKSLVVVSLVVVRSDNLISLAWMSDLEMKNFIFFRKSFNFFLGTLTLSGMCFGSPKIPAGIFFVKGFVFMTIYLLYETVEFKKSTAEGGGQQGSIRDPDGEERPQPQEGQPSRTSNQLSEAELRTISATIMAHELILQRRYDDWLRATAESGLPSYEEIARVIAEEKKAEKGHQKVSLKNPTGKSPPPNYGEALLLPGQVYNGENPNIFHNV